MNMQTDLITKLDKKLQDSQDQLKASRKKEKHLEIKLSDALRKNNDRVENNKVDKSAAYSIKCRECQFVCETEEELKEHKRNKKSEYRSQSPTYNTQLQEGPLAVEHSKCDKCNFINKNRVLLEEHKEKNHKGIKCTRCEVISPDLQSYKKHGELQHDFPVYSLDFKCTPCKESYRTDDDLMEHISQVHLTESQLEGHGLFKYAGMKASRTMTGGGRSAEMATSAIISVKTGVIYSTTSLHRGSRAGITGSLPPVSGRKCQVGGHSFKTGSSLSNHMCRKHRDTVTGVFPPKVSSLLPGVCTARGVPWGYIVCSGMRISPTFLPRGGSSRKTSENSVGTSFLSSPTKKNNKIVNSQKKL